MRKFLVFLVLSIVVGLIGRFTSDRVENHSDELEAERIQLSILELDERLQDVLNLIDRSNVELSSLRHLWKEESIGLVVYQHNRAVLWTTNSIPFRPEFDERNRPEEGIVKLRDVWYLCRTIEHDDELLVAYAFLRSDFDFQNRYIKNGWSKRFHGTERFIFTSTGHQDFPISLTDGKSTVGLRIDDRVDPNTSLGWNGAIWILFLVLLITTIWHAANWVSELSTPLFGNGCLVLLLVLLRALMLWWEMPEAIYSLELFGPTPHATSAFIPSLGDLVLHLVILLMVVVRFSHFKWQIANPLAKRFFALSLPIILIWPVRYLFNILVVNSSFSLDLNSPFSLDVYSFIGLGASFLILLNYYLLFRKLTVLVQYGKRTWNVVLPWLIIGTVLLMVMLGFDLDGVVLSVVSGSLLGLLILGQHWLDNRSGIYFHAPNILVFSIIACLILTDSTTRNEHDNRVALARSLEQQQDPITEYLFNELADEIRSDRQLRVALTSDTLNSIKVLDILHQKLSYDHLNRYQALVDIFNHEGGVLVSDRERTGPNYFELQSSYQNARPTISDRLRYVASFGTSGGYLARINIQYPRKKDDLIMFVTLIPEKTDDILGFTDLFVDEAISTASELEGYSYALYQDGELQDQQGEHSYSLNDRDYRELRKEITFFDRDGYSHLVVKPMYGRVVVVSRPSQGLLSYVTMFSYLFLFYLACSGVVALVSGRLIMGIVERRSFRNRINLAMSSVSFISLVLIGVLTVVYVVREYNGRNEEMISEKSRSVLIELEHKLRDRESFSEQDKTMLSTLLVKFSKVFFTDINLYHLDGHLLATSRPRLFDEGLMAEVIDPKAYEEMRFGQRSSFIHHETIGNLDYLTAYVPFRNEKREVIAFMSLPYFARQYGLQQEIFSLLATLTNIYVFLILISVVLALVISNRITEPLRFIRESLRNLKLDQTNRAIDWQSNDEIGELVEEYNRTLHELVQSAELLARSERESAWREMAKQVAHEIKNPLTPMKLSIQMLQRNKADGAKDLDERIDKVSNTLIEQIDTLSHIATEFSSFAQMPKSNIEDVDLVELLNSSLELHRNAEAQITTEILAETTAIAKADKAQMLRVLNNLIKNGIQAVPVDRQALITLGLIRDGNVWIASVKDNGTGIPEELRDKIFVPNFTTKSSGMGLGLAMVKNIVESVNGKIWFVSKDGEGTTFYISLPAI